MKNLVVGITLFLVSTVAQAVMIWGPPTPLGNGSARVFVEADDNGEPLSIGVGFAKEALEGLPEHDHGEYVVALPSVVNLPPYNHVVVNWAPQGHEPEGIYGLPHFDFHFYVISPEARQAITCQGDDLALCLKQPEPDKIPPFYVPTPDPVPGMGLHWFDPRSPEHNGQPFTSTFIYGSYNGEINFLEPMITREFIQATTSFESEISVPVKAPMKGYYPQKYSLVYDDMMGMHLLRMQEFTKKE